jgi:hypothetical protein
VFQWRGGSGDLRESARAPAASYTEGRGGTEEIGSGKPRGDGAQCEAEAAAMAAPKSA